MVISSDSSISQYLENFTFNKNINMDLFSYDNNSEISNNTTIINDINIGNQIYQKYINEYWTSKQRQSSSIHEISYRACFKAQLPRFFINLLTKENDIVYDPFSGRGTTVIEAGILGRKIISNDINPLSGILAYPRFFYPKLNEITERLDEIKINSEYESEMDLSMFFHSKTLGEIISIKNYLREKNENNEEDLIDKWIRMVATNRLTGHSKGFFSVYTLPPNQAVSRESQIKINIKRNQKPEYRDVRHLIRRKTKTLVRTLSENKISRLKEAGETCRFLVKDVRNTPEIENSSVQLIVTSPPFLNIVQYANDNWLRCWFNSIDVEEVASNITMSKTIENWEIVMGEAFKEFYRIIQKGGWVAFEVGEIKNGKIKLDERVIPLGVNAGFKCKGIVVNSQKFTKTSNIWGINNMKKGTNTNRIVLFVKE